MSENDGIRQTEEQKRRQRARSRAIGITLGVLAVLFFVITLVKMGPGIMNRPL
ncbi:hypothetical protein [Stappia sp.]|jgi:hypothetical protein|uniref:hypothetical protein n=1 Tax=Stappia sp. TaxID=1870903 RepID=UPI003A98E2E5